MDFIYQQVDLEDGELQEAAKELIDNISEHLHGYADNGPVRISLPYCSDKNFAAVLERLRDYKVLIFNYWFDDSEETEGCTVAIINRYKFNLLEAELTWLARPEEERGPDDNTAPYADDLVYYDIVTGDILFNGVFKTLKGRNKKLFDTIFNAAPDYYVSRARLLRIARTGKYANEPPGSVVSDAFTNLRKVCGVRAHTIPATSDGGRWLNAVTYPMTAQLPNYWIGFEEYRSKSRKELFDTSVIDSNNP